MVLTFRFIGLEEVVGCARHNYQTGLYATVEERRFSARVTMLSLIWALAPVAPGRVVVFLLPRNRDTPQASPLTVPAPDSSVYILDVAHNPPNRARDDS